MSSDRFEHPHGVYACDVPNGWIAVHRPDDCTSVKPAEDAKGELTLVLVGKPAKAQDEAREALKDVMGECGMESTGEVQSEAPERAWCDASWTSDAGESESGRVWLVGGSAFSVLACYGGPVDRQPDAEAELELAMAAVASLNLTENEGAIDLPASVARLIKVHRPEWKVETAGLALRVHTGVPGGTKVGLSNLFAACNADPGETVGVISHFVEQLVETLPTRDGQAGPPALEDVLPRLRPQLRSSEDIDSQATPVTVPFLEGLDICLVIDDSAGVRAVLASWLMVWNRTANDLLKEAYQNLEQGSSQVGLRISGPSPDEAHMIMVSEEDGYDATRIVLNGFLELLSEHLGSPFLIGIPTRDFLVAFRESDPVMVTDFQAKVREQSQSEPHSLTGRLLRYELIEGKPSLQFE